MIHHNRSYNHRYLEPRTRERYHYKTVSHLDKYRQACEMPDLDPSGRDAEDAGRHGHLHDRGQCHSRSSHYKCDQKYLKGEGSGSQVQYGH